MYALHTYMHVHIGVLPNSVAMVLHVGSRLYHVILVDCICTLETYCAPVSSQ